MTIFVISLLWWIPPAFVPPDSEEYFAFNIEKIDVE